MQSEVTPGRGLHGFCASRVRSSNRSTATSSLKARLSTQLTLVHYQQAGKPQTLYAGPIEDVTLQRIGPCTYHAATPLKHSWEPRPRRNDGFYFVNANFVNRLGDSFPRSWLSYDEATATFTVPEADCARGVENLVVRYQTFVWSANE